MTIANLRPIHAAPSAPRLKLPDDLINPLTASGPLARWRPPPPVQPEQVERTTFFTRSVWGGAKTHLGDLPPSRKHHRLSNVRSPGEEFDA